MKEVKIITAEELDIAVSETTNFALPNANRAFNLALHPQESYNYKKVLCVCAAGLLRSPTIAWVLSNPPFNFNTRSCGAEEDFALIPLTDNLISWADEIVCANQEHLDEVNKRITMDVGDKFLFYKPIIHCLYIEDNYNYKDPYLVKLVYSKCLDLFQIKG